MGVVFSIAIVLGGEEVLTDAANARGGSREEGGEVGGHSGECAPTDAIEMLQSCTVRSMQFREQ
jgi:hypothetical protein